MQKLIKTMVVILLTALSASLAAAPDGFSVNADSGTENAFSLYRIDLATGTETWIGFVQPAFGEPRQDVEGLAFDPDETLYGIDDETLTLFKINTDSGFITNPVNITGLGTPGKNDFGMTFACDGDLYLTSVVEGFLYRVNLISGVASQIGKLNANISAIAAYGNPVRLYGLGNGLKLGPGEVVEVDSPYLYKINTATGAATKIGQPPSGLVPPAGEYFEGGLAFDDAGQLWAITDRRRLNLPSQVMRINSSTGAASDVSKTTEQGFESLAITVPKGCADTGGSEHAQFVVQKRFADGNDITPVELSIECKAGLPLEQSLTVRPNEGAFGKFEVNFSVGSFIDGELECEVREKTPDGYAPTYDCQSDTRCSTNDSDGPCLFQNVGIGDVNLCLIQNYVEPVDFTVTKEWLYLREETAIPDEAGVTLHCSNVVGGDGVDQNGIMRWNWIFGGDIDSHTATLQPDFDGSTQCWAEEQYISSAVEVEITCANGVTVEVGDDPHSCIVTNTVFFEGIPTLNQYGLLLLSALMLLMGMAAARRF
jgi:hypothetical protein